MKTLITPRFFLIAVFSALTTHSFSGNIDSLISQKKRSPVDSSSVNHIGRAGSISPIPLDSKYDKEIGSGHTTEDIKENRIQQQRKETENIVISIITIIVIGASVFLIFYYLKKQTKKSVIDNLSKETKIYQAESSIELKDIASELEKINDLKTKGVISGEEFIKLKERIIK
jgi:hypothetical protein